MPGDEHICPEKPAHMVLVEFKARVGERPQSPHDQKHNTAEQGLRSRESVGLRVAGWACLGGEKLPRCPDGRAAAVRTTQEVPGEGRSLLYIWGAAEQHRSGR